MELIAWEPSLAWKLYTCQPFIFSALELFNQAKNIPRGSIQGIQVHQSIFRANLSRG